MPTYKTPGVYTEEIAGDIAVEPARAGRLVLLNLLRDEARAATKRYLTGKELIQNCPQCVDVTPPIREVRIATGLLR